MSTPAIAIVKPTTGSDKADFFLKGLTKASTGLLSAKLATPTPIDDEAYESYVVTKDPGALFDEETATTADRIGEGKLGLYRLLVAIATTTGPVMAGKHTDLEEVNSWKNWLATLASCIFTNPFSVAEVGAGVTEVPQAICRNLIMLVRSETERKYEASGGGEAGQWAYTWPQIWLSYRAIAAHLGLPPVGNPGADQIDKLPYTGSALQKASFYALAVYLCGRPVVNRTDSIGLRRPDNLQKKFNNGQVWVEIGGVLKASEGAWKRIGQAWELDPRFRQALITPLIGLSQGQTGTVGAVIATFMELLEWAQLAHIPMIARLIRAHPWVSNMAEFSSEIYLLASDTERLDALEPHKRPYEKMLKRDLFKIYDGRALLRLTKIANFVLADREAGHDKYEIGGPDPVLLARFHTLQAIHEPDVARDARAADDVARAVMDVVA